MPKGVKLSLSDKFHRVAMTASVDETVTAIAKMFVFSLKDATLIKMHEIFGEIHVRGMLMYAELQEILDAEKAAARKKPKPAALATITKATAPRKVRRTPKGQAGKPDTGKTIQRRKRRAF